MGYEKMIAEVRALQTHADELEKENNKLREKLDQVNKVLMSYSVGCGCRLCEGMKREFGKALSDDSDEGLTYYEIIGGHTKTRISVCTSAGIDDARLEEPSAAIRPISKEEFFKVWNGDL